MDTVEYDTDGEIMHQCLAVISRTVTYPVTYTKGNEFARVSGDATIDDREAHLEGGVSETEEPPYCPVEVFVTAVNPIVKEEKQSNSSVDKPIGLEKNSSNSLAVIYWTATQSVKYINKPALVPGDTTYYEEVHLERGVLETEEPPYCPVEVFVTADNTIVTKENLSNPLVENPVVMENNPSHPDNTMMERNLTYFVVKDPVMMKRSSSYSALDNTNTVVMQRNPSYSALDNTNTVVMQRNPSYSALDNTNTVVMQRNPSYSALDNTNTVVMQRNPSYSALDNTNTVVMQRNPSYSALDNTNTVVMQRNPSYSALDNTNTVVMQRNPSYSALDNTNTVVMQRNPSYSALDNTNTLNVGRNLFYSDPQDTDAQETDSPLNVAPSTTAHDDGSDSDHDYIEA